MNEQEQAVNRDLQALGDDYRRQQIDRDEYRRRRRLRLAGFRHRHDAGPERLPAPGTGAAPEENDRDRAATARRSWWPFGLALLIGAAAVLLWR